MYLPGRGRGQEKQGKTENETEGKGEYLKEKNEGRERKERKEKKGKKEGNRTERYMGKEDTGIGTYSLQDNNPSRHLLYICMGKLLRNYPLKKREASYQSGQNYPQITATY